MLCEKYSGWMTDAALGELSPPREREVLAHIAECDACGESFAQAKVACAAVDAGLRALAGGSPSAQFAAKLRARIAAEPEAPLVRHIWPSWVPATAAVLAAAAALLIALHAHSPRDGGPNASPPIANRVQPAPARQLALRPPLQTTPTLPPRHTHSSRAAGSTTAGSSEPEVLVEPGQFAAIVRYSNALTLGMINGDQVIAAQEASEKPLEIKFLEIEPADIAPLKNPDSDGETPPREDSNLP